jgi:HSP20 family protein
MTMSTMQQGRPSAAMGRRLDPFREMEDVYDRMGVLVQDLFGDGGTGIATRWPAVPADIEETDDAYLVELDLPGARGDDLKVELRNSELHISGEIKEPERKGILRRKGRSVGRFDHLVRLPGEVDPDKVQARLADGVLMVRVCKTKASQPRRIAVSD